MKWTFQIILVESPLGTYLSFGLENIFDTALVIFSWEFFLDIFFFEAIAAKPLVQRSRCFHFVRFQTRCRKKDKSMWIKHYQIILGESCLDKCTCIFGLENIFDAILDIFLLDIFSQFIFHNFRIKRCFKSLVFLFVLVLTMREE